MPDRSGREAIVHKYGGKQGEAPVREGGPAAGWRAKQAEMARDEDAKEPRRTGWPWGDFATRVRRRERAKRR